MAKSSRPSTGTARSGATPARAATAARTAAKATPTGRAAAAGATVAARRKTTSSKPAGGAPAGGRHAKKGPSLAGRVQSKAASGATELGSGAKRGAGAVKSTVISKSNKALMAEFLICMSVLGLGTMVPTPAGRPKEGVPHLMVKSTAISLLFFVLSLIGAAGDRSRRAAGGLGAVVTVGYLVTSPDAYNIVHWLTGFYSKPGTPGAGLTEAAARDQSLVTYTPAVPYPWQVQTSIPQAGGPSAAGSGGAGGGGELVA